MKNILVNFSSNLGDTVLGLKVLDRLRANYPQNKITAIASAKTQELLNRITSLDKVILYNKSWPIKDKLKFVLSLRGQYSLIADLKNSGLPIMLGIRKHTPFIRLKNPNQHVRDDYLELVKKIAPKEEYLASEIKLFDDEIIKLHSLKLPSAIFIALSSRSSLKAYPYEYLKELIELLTKIYTVVIVGDNQEVKFYADLLTLPGVVNLVGKTKIFELFYLLKNYCRCLVCVDSAILHIASYLNLPIVALFGPTSDKRYGPWSDKSIVLKNTLLNCTPCSQAQCPNHNHTCMNISADLIKEAIEKLIL